MTLNTIDRLGDRWLTGSPTYIPNLEGSRPLSSLSDTAKKGHWRKLKYKTEDLEGIMLLAGPETGAPNITIPLNCKGWHSISIGVLAENEPVRLLVKLTDSKTFSVLTLNGQENKNKEQELTELFFKISDITEQDLIIGQISWQVSEGVSQNFTQSTTASIAYIKLIPLSSEEQKDYIKDLKRTDTRSLFAHNDAHTVHYASRPTTNEEIRRHLENYRDSDISRLYWEAGQGQQTFYFSKIGTPMTADNIDDFPRQGDRLFAESWRIFRERKVDPFELALEYAHQLGIEFHACYRPAGFHFPPQHNHFTAGSTFYQDNQELRCKNKYGDPTPRISYAYPETRNFVISLIKEIASFKIDGICILYNRRPPLVEYDNPLIESFKNEYNIDPRDLDDLDTRWLSHKSEALTSFHRELRKALDQISEQRRPGTKLEISTIVMSNHLENLQYGMDLQTWINEDLVDTIIPYHSNLNLDSSQPSWDTPEAIDYFLSLTNNTKCKLAPNLMPREITSEQYRERSHALYSRGVQNLFLWDTDIQQPRINNSGPWETARRLGHRDEIDSWKSSGSQSLAPTTKKLLTLDDWDLSYETPG